MGDCILIKQNKIKRRKLKNWVSFLIFTFATKNTIVIVLQLRFFVFEISSLPKQ